MLKKEFRDIIKPTLVRLSFLLIIPLLALFKVSLFKIFHFLSISVLHIIKAPAENIYLSSFIFLLGLMIFWTANHFGSNAFREEYRDRAFEYLFSFPFSKSRLFFYKFIPRVSILVVLVALYEVLAFFYVIPMRDIKGALFFLIDPVFFPFWVIFFFMGGFFVGLFEQKNWIAVVTLTVFYSSIPISLGVCKRIIRSIEPNIIFRNYFTGLSFIFGTLIILLVLGVAFFIVYRKFDMKSFALYSRRFAFIVLPPLVSLTVLGIYLLIFQMKG